MPGYTPQHSLFSITEKLRAVADFLFWAVFILSAIPTILSLAKIQWSFDELINVVNILAIVVFFSFDIIIEYFLVPQAENKRRDDFLDNSFGSNFTVKSSEQYFDTVNLDSGLYKAAANLFENSYFTYSVLKSVTTRKIIVPAIAFLAIFVFAYYGFRQAPFALSVLQVLFSANLLGGLIKHLVLIAKLNTLNDEWIGLFQQQDFKINISGYAPRVYRYWLRYETLLSRIQAAVPEIVFSRFNKQLTEEWSEIMKRYKI